MNSLIWNYRGARKLISSNHLSRLIRLHNLGIIVLLETRVAGASAQKVCIHQLGLGWDSKFIVYVLVWGYYYTVEEEFWVD